MADERAIGEHIVPKITKAAENAGRPAPRVVAGIPVTLCSPSQVDEARARANRILAEATPELPTCRSGCSRSATAVTSWSPPSTAPGKSWPACHERP